jgi:hypothetical protein
MKALQRHLTYANVMATLGVFLALGGVSYAALKLPKNSVGSKQIKKNAISSSKVKNGALKKDDFATGQLPAGAAGAPGAQGLPGAKGDKGLKGDKGDQGDTGTFGEVTTVFEKATADLANSANGNYDVYCPAGKIAIGGGGRGDDTLSEQTILANTRPAISSSNPEPPLAGQGFTGWRITIVNPAGGDATGIKPEVWAICATP